MSNSTTTSTSVKTRDSLTTPVQRETSPLSSMSFADRAEMEEREGNRAFLAEIDRLRALPATGKPVDPPAPS